MKVLKLLPKSLNQVSNRSKKLAACLGLISLVFLYNLSYNLDAANRQLSEERAADKISNVLSRAEITAEFMSHEEASNEEKSFLSRYLSINLGGGRCKLTPPQDLPQYDTTQTTTLLTSYPGSGKRLVWRLLEGLTGYRTGDDWDLSQNGLHVLTMKTSYPHHEGVWSWGDRMDQAVLLVRNPRFAIPSYHTMRYELDYSGSWQKSFSRINNTYTERPVVEEWVFWRDLRFDNELNAWANFTEYWLTGGEHRVNNLEEFDHHCVDHLISDGSVLPKLMDCKPKAVIQFEKLYSTDEQVGTTELLKLASAIDGVERSSLIDVEARPCVYKEVMKNRNKYNPNRDGKGPAPEEKKFTPSQLTKMINVMKHMKDKFNTAEWVDDIEAVTLVMILDSYITEVQQELDASLQGGITVEPTPSPVASAAAVCTDIEGWYFNQDPVFTCALIEEMMCDQISEIFKTEQNGVTANDACCICGGGNLPASS